MAGSSTESDVAPFDPAVAEAAGFEAVLAAAITAALEGPDDGVDIPAPMKAAPRGSIFGLTGPILLSRYIRICQEATKEGLVYDLADLLESSHPVLTTDLAVICPNYRVGIHTKEAIIARFMEIFAGFDMKCLCVAGGAVSACFKSGASVDITELFFVGLSADKIIRKITALGDHLLSKMVPGSLVVYRTSRCVTFKGRPVGSHQTVKIQMILKSYDSVGDVILGFDLGSSAVAYDPSEKIIVCTPMGALAQIYGLNVVDLGLRRGGFEGRVIKYFKRGYSLVLPEFDVAKFVAGSFELMTLVIRKYGERLRPEEIFPVLGTTAKPGSLIARNGHITGEGIRPLGDTSALYEAMPYYDLGRILLMNATAVLATPPDVGAMCAGARYIEGMDVSTTEVSFDRLGTVLAHILQKREIDPVWLSHIIGQDGTVKIMDQIIHGKPVDYEAIARAMAPIYAARAKLPFAIMPRTPPGVLPPTDPPHPAKMTPEAWYGKYWKGAAAADRVDTLASAADTADKSAATATTPTVQKRVITIWTEY